MKALILTGLLCMGCFYLNAQNLHFGFEQWSNSLDYMPVPDEPTTPGNPPCHAYLQGNAEFINSAGEVRTTDVLSGWSTNISGILRSADSHSGRYAAIVHQWYNGATGVLAYGAVQPAGSLVSDIPKVRFTHKLYGISGFYQYRVDSFIVNDTYNKVAILHIVTYKETAGMLEQKTHDSLLFGKTDKYKTFYLPVSDTSLIPDSVSIWFESKGYNSGTTFCEKAHFLYLDDLQFHFNPYTVSIDEHQANNHFSIYPNPAIEFIRLKYKEGIHVQNIQLTDIAGKLIRTFSGRDKVLDIRGVAGGIYILTIQTRAGQFREKIEIR